MAFQFISLNTGNFIREGLGGVVGIFHLEPLRLEQSFRTGCVLNAKLRYLERGKKILIFFSIFILSSKKWWHNF